MPFMRKINSITLLSVLMGFYSYAQTNNLTASPYSLFGLGVENNSGMGRFSGLANTGTALDAANGINLYNPAAFATMLEDHFVFEFGATAEITNISNSDINEVRNIYNFSNISVGFNHNKYGLGLTLKPTTNIGYELTGLQNNVEGSNDEFSTNILGSGGINELRLDYGYELLDNLNIGAKASYLFGKIEESESITTSSSYLEISDESFYSGAQLGLGAQYQLLNKHNFGIILDFPVNLKATKNSLVQKYSSEGTTTLEDSEDERIDDFTLPLKFGFGYSTKIKNIVFAMDYSKKFWSSTNQSDAIGDYTDQSIFSFGASYLKDSRSLKYWQRMDYRIGFNYNSGYLKVDDTRIDSYNTSLGIGFPIGRSSMINFSYTFSNRGTTNSILIEERSSILNFNITLSDLWFQQRKYN
ncbi:MAG: hypothetical protein CMC76_00935 [Flavobacteriaceae bacterium]|nr:hypothetical protein [Flavobacteriaceae bacterium]